jgi:hypothetical protein
MEPLDLLELTPTRALAVALDPRYTAADRLEALPSYLTRALADVESLRDELGR